ncbi:CU044_5270 family protein [Actinoplanes oblitus]|uniref:CU044_5270 family protein n=1 Tax=Actinoplanes oblitus TaxID=3040509 RepID=A0ABY8WRZ8_9ACTN|nr:CU044_5270 family protein [Actinoplanes oblitus]WIN00616.1 CU044_5270 family protein [Actinoplanes oblitus]
MDEISILRDTFGPDAAPAPEARQRARAALRDRIAEAGRPGRRRHWHWHLRIPIAVGLAGAAAAAVAVVVTGHDGGMPAPVMPAVHQGQGDRPATMPYLEPVSAAQYLENAAWTVERQPWTDPEPDQFMYVETRELRNPAGYENQHPNGSLLPGKAKYRRIQEWQRIDGEVWARTRNTGKIEVDRQGEDGVSWGVLDYSRLRELTTPEKVRDYLDHPGPISMDPAALIGRYVLPPKVEAAFFRYLAQLPGMKVNQDAVNIDGRPAIGMGRIEEGNLSKELLFDKRTYRLIGDRLIVVADERKDSDDGFRVDHKGDVLRQVIYTKQIIVDKLFDTK